jgi:hypothetical protein
VVYSEKHEKVKESRKEKLNRLNPMNRLLRRRSSQTQLDNRNPTLSDDFDPGIIYGTRHPDWSSHPKRMGGDRRSFSPVPIGPGSPGFPPGADGKKRKNSEDRISIGARIGSAPTSPAAAPPGMTLPSPVSPITPPTPLEPEPTEPGEISSAPPSRRGVTLVDHPLALSHHHVVNASRFSFEGSSNVPSATTSVAPSIKIRDPDDASIDESFDLDLDDDLEDDGFARANEGIFLHPPRQEEVEQMEELETVNPPEQDQYTALQAAVEAMNLIMPESSSSGIEELPSMDPRPSVIANPRGLDLSDSDFEFIDSPSELMAYEAEDDDLYYDDGIINELVPPLGQPDPSPLTPEVDPRISLLPQDGSPTSPSPDPTAFPPFINPIGGGLGCTQQNAQFYAPPPPLLTQLLRQYQQQQLTISTTSLPSPVPPSPIYPSSDSYDYDGFDDGPGDDLDLVEAANADALASDSEFYRSEFGTGFFSSPSTYREQHHHGGGAALTPISERSEGGSYRNSLVVGNYGDLAKGEEEKEIGELLRRREVWGTTGGGGGDGGAEWETVAVAAGGVSPGGGVGLGEVAEEEAYEGVEVALRKMEDPPLPPPPPGSPGGGVGLGEVAEEEAYEGVEVALRKMEDPPLPPPPPGLVHPGGRGMVPTKGSFEEEILGGV